VSELPPEPAEPSIVQTMRWLTRPVPFMESCRRRYGDAFSLRFVGFERPTVFLTDPEAIKALYTEQAHGLPRGRTVALRPILGADSVLLLEGSEHIARRRLMLPPFHGERMRSYESIVHEVAQAEIASWPVGQTFALHPRMQAITLEVILRAVFGVVDEQRRRLLSERLPLLLSENSSIWFQLRVLLSSRTKSSRDPRSLLQEQLAQIDELLLAEIAERRTDPTLGEREDILSLLLAARFEDGTQMSDRELRDQLLTLLLAGHETTATALAWTVDLLLRNPAALARLRQEIQAGEDDEYLRATVTEALRLRPVVPLAGRRLNRDLDAPGLHLPAGTDVTPAIWLTHTRADLYPQPYEFRPERFLGEAPATYGWIPFGGGVRRCLGASFAEFEMRIVLQLLMGSCVLSPARRRPEAIARRNVTFSPRHGTKVRLDLRTSAPARALAPAA
jgi:cytochrome P450